MDPQINKDATQKPFQEKPFTDIDQALTKRVGPKPLEPAH